MRKRLIDILLVLLAVPIAYALRLEMGVLEYVPDLLKTTFAMLPFALAVLTYKPISAQTWHKVGIRDMMALLRVAVLLGASLMLFKLLSGELVAVPKSVLLIYPSLVLLFLSIPRLLSRYLFEEKSRKIASEHGGRQRVLIVGAGEAGAAIAREIFRHPEMNIRPIGFVDDDSAKQGVTIMGLRVLGRILELETLIPRHQIDEVLIAMPSASGDVIRDVVMAADDAKVKHRILPALYTLLNGEVSINRLRKVDVEDLLRRDPIRLDLDPISGYLANQVVLVTGAGGSIGSEIVRQIAAFHPKEVVLLGRGENSIFETVNGLESRYPHLKLVTCISDVRDWDSLEHLFETHRPSVVFHAAAHKHVHLMERNPAQAILNNVVGTRNLVELALKYDVHRFVNVSTDKAVNPTSVMGASKRVSEYLVEHAASKAKMGQSFVSVRFGNVLGTRGSVVPIFKRQIAEGLPITVTHPDMTRYFMTIPEASQLVLQAGGLAENGAVYVLDMGKPVKIVDLAKDLIRLSGLEVGKDIDIVYKGIQPGEKLFEELLTDEEGTTATRHSKIYMARKQGLPDEAFERSIEELVDAARSMDGARIRQALKRLIPTYRLEESAPERKAADS
jgi:FlaA1/EpsC-like NDP-sugar epimerase